MAGVHVSPGEDIEIEEKKTEWNVGVRRQGFMKPVSRTEFQTPNDPFWTRQPASGAETAREMVSTTWVSKPDVPQTHHIFWNPTDRYPTRRWGRSFLAFRADP